MPIYEYTCQQCGAQTEKFESVSAPHATHCDACGQESLKRMVSAPNFQLKGSGWYVTDFKNKPTHSTTKQEAATPAAADASQSTDTTGSSEA